MDTLLIFFLNRSFLEIVEKNQKPVFLNYRVPPILYIILIGAQNFKFVGFIYATLIGIFYTLFRIQVQD